MTVIEVAGKQVDVGDEFLKLSPDDQQKTVNEIAGTIAKPAANTDVSANNLARSAATGVPIIGGALNQANAATNAALSYPLNSLFDEKDQLKGTFNERRTQSLKQQQRMDKEFSDEHPIIDTAAQFTGGAAAMAPLAASSVAAKALGMSGTLPQMVTRGAISGAGIGAADEAIRTGNPMHGAQVGAITGGGFPVVARTIGKAVQAFRGPGPRPAPTADINGEQVPQFESARTGDNLAGSQEQAAFSGAKGPDAQRVAQEAFDARDAAMERARSKFGDELSPATDPRLGAAPGEAATPHAAGGQVITELAQRNNDDMQRRALAGIAGEVSDTTMRRDIGGAARPQTVMPANAYDAAEGVGAGVARSARTAADLRTTAYRTAGETEGEFSPAGFRNISNSIRDRLNRGAAENRVTVNERTPLARDALEIIENEIGSGRTPTNLAARGQMVMGPDGRPMAPPITGRDVETVRKLLVPLMKDANNKARGAQPDATDQRAMRRIMEAFDNHVRDVVQGGGFSGDGAELLRRYETARNLHSNYRNLYSARGQGDTVGPVVEKIIGKHPGQQMTPDQIAAAAYGPAASPGGGNTVAVNRRLRDVLGENSPEWAAHKQGLLSHLLDTPQGVADLTPAQQADRIYSFVQGTRGRALAEEVLTAPERTRLLEHADQLRALAPTRGPLTAVDKQIMRLAGADGHDPATSRTAVDMLMSGDGTKGSGVQLAQRLKQTLSPESWDSIRQGAWTHLTSKPEGVIDFGPQALSQRIHKFLSEPIAETLFSAKERQMIKIIGDEYKKMIPLPNTTNPSGSGIFGAKMLRAAQGNLLPMLGLATHGVGGVLAGAAANKALAFTANRKAVNQAKDLFYGKATKRAAGSTANMDRAAAIIAKASQPLMINGQ